MTIIFSNMLDSDCQVLRCTWQNISDVNIVEITPDMNIDEAETSVNNAIYAYTQNDIDLNGIRFYANINQLLIDKIPLDQWVMILGAKMDIENEIDVFNRKGLFYQE